MSRRDLSKLVIALAGEKLKDGETVADWLDKTLEKAAKVYRGTHGLKFSHSAIPHGGVSARIESPDMKLVGTHSLPAPVTDTFCDAAALGIGKLLDIAEDGESIANQVLANDPVTFQPLAKDEAQLTTWLDNLSVAVGSKVVEPHALNKQFYFPVDNGYHLLSPLHSSALSHLIHEHVELAKSYSDQTKEARKAMNQKQQCEYDLVIYKELAHLKFGGAQPQNVSLLNSQRRGVSYLLCCLPPIWQDQNRLPIKGKSALWHMFSHRVWWLVKDLREFLASVEGKNNVQIRTSRASFIDQLIDELLNLRAGIVDVGNSGWSRESELSVAEQCFLDPYRNDGDENSKFMEMRETREWEEKVGDAFAVFVNEKLARINTQSGDQLRELGDVEHKEWRDELRHRLSRFRHYLEAIK